MAQLIDNSKRGVISKCKNLKQPKKDFSSAVVRSNLDNNLRIEINAIFGDGYSESEYIELYKIYQEYLNNYALKTQSHKRALIKVCKCTLRFDQAIAFNNTGDAKYWGDLLSKALQEAKINPNQLSAADLSDGISGFSQLSAAIEKSKNICDVLPKYKENPRDKADMVLYFYISYICKLDNKPIPEYNEIYGFMKDLYNKNLEKYKDIMKDMVSNKSENIDGRL